MQSEPQLKKLASSKPSDRNELSPLSKTNQIDNESLDDASDMLEETEIDRAKQAEEAKHRLRQLTHER